MAIVESSAPSLPVKELLIGERPISSAHNRSPESLPHISAKTIGQTQRDQGDCCIPHRPSPYQTPWIFHTQNYFSYWFVVSTQNCVLQQGRTILKQHGKMFFLPENPWDV